MTEKPIPAPTKTQDVYWYALVGLALVCVTVLAIFVPDVFTKLERIIDRMPSAAQITALIGAAATVGAMWRSRTRPILPPVDDDEDDLDVEPTLPSGPKAIRRRDRAPGDDR
ncbi:MAG: hypothetical protein M3Q55_15280 [Acidobacteriota bacterium]|nr:hypothetical protein [Acidobacteriota bacterium]